MESKIKTETVEERTVEIVCDGDNQPVEPCCNQQTVPAAEDSSGGPMGEPCTVAEVQTAPQTTGDAAQESAMSAPTGVQAAVSMSATTHYPVYFVVESSDGRLKQAFNAIYFASAAVAAAVSVHYLQMHVLWPLVAFLGLAGLFAIRFALNNRAHSSDFETNIPLQMRRLIRGAALLAPIPLIFYALNTVPANNEYQTGARFYADEDYTAAIPHLEAALKMNPQLHDAQRLLANSYFYANDFDQALTTATSALSYYPNDSDLLAQDAFGLNRNGEYQAALSLAQQATRLDPKNGQAFADLAESNYRLGRFNEALEAASVHIKLHSDESDAYRTRETILSALGRYDDAKLDSTTATQLEQNEANDNNDNVNR